MAMENNGLQNKAEHNVLMYFDGDTCTLVSCEMLSIKLDISIIILIYSEK